MKKFIINIHDLKKGDIVLTSEKKGIVSFLVRFMLWSQFSHAYIYMEHYCYEIDGKGVIMSTVDKKLFSIFDSVKVLRLKDELSSTQIDQLENYLKKQRGASYSTIMAIKSKFKLNTSEENGKFFCSHLVVKAYEMINIKLFSNKPAYHITPKDLLKCSNLKVVPFKRILLSNEILEYLSLKPDTSRRLQKAECEITSFLAFETKNPIYNYYDSLKLIYEEALSEDVQNKIIDIYEKTSYYKILKEDVLFLANASIKDFFFNSFSFLYFWDISIDSGKNKTINDYTISNCLKLTDIFIDVCNSYFKVNFSPSIKLKHIKFNDNIENYKNEFKENIEILSQLQKMTTV